jgi:hypothetical protein
VGNSPAGDSRPSARGWSAVVNRIVQGKREEAGRRGTISAAAASVPGRKDNLKPSWPALTLLISALLAGDASPQVPALPAGAQTHWVVEQPYEIVAYTTFDPAKVARQLPKTLRFITLNELATSGVRWASDYLAERPAHGSWGVSFLEIIRAATFTIDGRAPKWPEQGAAALWCARVAPADRATDLGPGQPFLMLAFWMSDDAYASYMRGKGHPASAGDVTLIKSAEGRWRGSIAVAGLGVVADCEPTGAVTGGPGSAGMQAFFPPVSSALDFVVRVAFAGHRVQQCGGESSWHLTGSHPLAGGVVLRPSTLQFGYELVGGAYRR